MKKIIETLDDSAPFGVVVLNERRRIKAINPWLCQWTGRSHQQLAGQFFTDAFSREPGKTDADIQLRGALPEPAVLADSLASLPEPLVGSVRLFVGEAV
jgi:PAS domain-containing protein